MNVHAASVNRQEIDVGVRRAEQVLAPDIVHIRYDFGYDWTDEPSLFFRVVISDEAAKRPRLSDIAQAVSLTLRREVKTDEQGLHAYFNFRSLSELETMNEPEWE